MAAAILAATAAPALAATNTGAIKAISTKKTNAITLNNGNTFSVVQGAWEKSFKVGKTTVAVAYETSAGKMIATKVVAK
jgi:hypothetical protein